MGNRQMTVLQPMRPSVSICIAAVAAMACFSGCATIAGGGHDQRVHIDSEPRGAQVWVDGKPQGITPTDVELSRRQEHQVQVALDGYPPYVTALKPGCNPWVFGNLLAGGLVGLAVDASTGAVSTLYPSEVKTVFRSPPTPGPVQPLNAPAGNGSSPSGIQPASSRFPSGSQPIP
jgi:hypothetical protein